MNKKEFYNKLNGNENMKAVIYVASNYPNEKGLAECNWQIKKCKKFMEKYPNLCLVEEPFVDSSVGVRSLIARKPWVDFRICIDNEDIDVILIADFKDACCGVGGYIGMISLLNDHHTVIYSVQEDKIYDAKLLEKMRDAFYNASDTNSFGQKDLLCALYKKMHEDDLDNRLISSGKPRINF